MLELLQVYADRVPAEIQHLLLGDEVLIVCFWQSKLVEDH